MVNISAERINKTAPYKVEKNSRKEYVDFTTDFGVEYSVGYERSELMKSVETYEFVIVNVNHMKSPRDPKLRDTIMAIVYDFFLSSELAMLYICETGDEKQSMRDRLFRYWAATNPRFDAFSVWSAGVKDGDGVMNFATLILRNDNPKMQEAAAEFAATVKMLNEKPKV